MPVIGAGQAVTPQDTDVVEEYGGRIPLDNYGAVLVSGEDRHGHNRIAKRTVRGTPFQPRQLATQV